MPDNFRKVTQRPGILCRVQVSVAQCSLIVLSPPTRWKCAFSLGRFGQNANIWSIMLAKIRMLSFRAKICLWSFSVSKNIKTHSHFFHPEFLHTPNWRWARLSQCKSFVSKVLTEILIWVFFFSIFCSHSVFIFRLSTDVFQIERSLHTKHESRRVEADILSEKGKTGFSERATFEGSEVCAHRHCNYFQLKAYISKMQFASNSIFFWHWRLKMYIRSYIGSCKDTYSLYNATKMAWHNSWVKLLGKKFLAYWNKKYS